MFEKLEEKPLNYWEEESYIGVIQKRENITIEEINDAINNIRKDNEIEIVSIKELTSKEVGNIIFKYEENRYQIYFYPESYNYNNSFYWGNFQISEEEERRLKESKICIKFAMKFSNDAKKSFKAQLRLMLAMLPNSVCVVDESSERSLPVKWAKMIADSQYEINARDLFMVQAVSDEKDKVWLHTHGLARCGITELEILESNKEHFQTHYNIINSYASMLLENEKYKTEMKEGYFIGYLCNGHPIVVTHRIWTEGLKEYEESILGGFSDRIQEHNTKTSPIFIYKTEQDQIESKISKVTEYDNLIELNPIFFFSKEETENMKNIAQERFKMLDTKILKDANKIEAKIGILVGEEENEYMWAEILNIEENNIKARIQEDAYQIKDLKEGSIIETSIDSIADWQIEYEGKIIKPDNVYFYR